MWMSPPSILFSSSLILSIMIVACSSSLLMSWVGLELNTLAFIPLLMATKSKFSSEASIKYFLTQTLGSVIFVLGVLSGYIYENLPSIQILLLVSLVLKLGAAPFHSWVVSVAEACPWVILLVLLTVQKINPLLIIWSGSLSDKALTFGFIISSLIVGGVMGLIYSSIRALLVYSSISHIGWLLVATTYSLHLTSVYFAIYMLTLIPIIYLFTSFNVSNLNQLGFIGWGTMETFLIMISILSLGGLPPLLGFLPKWLVLSTLIEGGMIALAVVFILLSLFPLYFYLRVSFSSFLLAGGKLPSKSRDSLMSSIFMHIMFITTMLGLVLSVFI